MFHLIYLYICDNIYIYIYIYILKNKKNIILTNSFIDS